ncbi:MAG TPA: homoserine dehydrogenase [Terriglobales bacterium]|nr:homoserine dehydrogenase [Terriglobales bacterium]
MVSSIRQFEETRIDGAPVCKVALVGFGTVGSAVARLLLARGNEHPLQLTHICNRDAQRKRVEWVPDHVQWTDDIDEVLESDTAVIVELIGGLQPAYDWVRRALESAKSVVTANKQLIAHHGSELIELARANRQHLAFGACVAGGVPVLSGLHEGLAGDRLLKVCGILNGTCNYILTRIESGASFAEALNEAQAAGFAEADPTEDIDGLDARAKLVVLTRVGLNAEVIPQKVLCRSIRELAHFDFDYAHELGCTIRQVSRVELRDGKLLAAVELALVPHDSPLARVSGSQNLVISTGKFGGDTVFSGHGAGGNPTAVAVVSDLLHIVRYRTGGVAEPDRPAATPYEVSHDFETPHYLRFVVKDSPGIIAALAGVLSQHQINIDAVFQRPGHNKSALPFVITLESCKTGRAEAALAEISKFPFLVQAPLRIPILR